MEDLTNQAIAVLLVSLRIAPTLAFASPFTLLRVPASVRLVLAIALAGWLVAAHLEQSWRSDFSSHGLFLTALGELVLGVALSLSLQLAFTALLTAGRAIDIQAGFGLAVLIDPTTRSQMPLVGTLFAYAAGAIFFATNGPADLLAIWSASLERVPLGSAVIGGGVTVLGGYISAVFVIAFGLGGMVMLALFLADIAIAFMSRTLPQMNVMLLGFQVKAMATLAVLPIAISVSGAIFLRLLRYALETAPRLI
ncbi:type III secretion protein [Sphingomonas sp. HMWF008]|nr:type III secretion protein [Sphingomonas sp. HMWF008]